jgi:tetratricopeptide (TPR) repeat protein
MKKAGLAMVVTLLLVVSLLQWGVDRTPAGSAEASRSFKPVTASLLDFLGGIRQYFAYTIFIKTDKLSHTYSNVTQNMEELTTYLILITMLDPNYIDAYFIGAGFMSSLDRKDEAIEFTLQGIRDNPESADLYFSLGDIYLTMNRYNEATDAFIKAIQYEPQITSRFMIMRALSACYRALGDEEKYKKVLMDIVLENGILKYNQYLTLEEAKTIIDQINIFSNFVAGNESY